MAPFHSDPQAVSVERALAELRAGRPVLIEGEEPVLALGAEAFMDRADLHVASPPGARLVLPAPRLRRLGLDRDRAGCVALPVIDPARVEALALRAEAVFDAPVSPAAPADEEALELLRLAHLVPAALVWRASDVFGDPMRVQGEAVRAYRSAQARAIGLVARAPVPLEGAKNTEFAVFRGGDGMRDQVAVIVAGPDLTKPVAVRLHSACLTGDLFGSLKCDCGDQLRDTVRWMSANGGGIVLYLDQEGRGTGIANKIRAYGLQARGYDTYEADEVLGFGLDGRRFDFAAAMLRELGVSRVLALTNNPDKIAALRAGGLDVVSDRRVLGRRTAENVRYLAAKRDRAGHLLEVDCTVDLLPGR